MDIQPPTVARPAPTMPAAAASGATPGPSKTTSDFDTFLRLLTAQIRNQDPLEPADATAFTAQLATFSNVEQAVQTNTLLKEMMTRMDGRQVAEAAAYIGMEARHSGPVGHAGGQATLFAAINPAADRAELVVADLAGREIARHPVDPKAPSLGWPAAGQGGSVADGQYRLHVESWSGAQALAPAPVAHYARVEEVVLGAGGAEVVLRGGVRLPMAEVESIRGGAD